jgi:tripartite-type tricarboxylate transporter receptor subunit TctC
MNRREIILGATSALAAVGLAPPVWAQADYPNRPIRLMVPFAPGGVTDVTARIWAEKVRPSLGTIVIENQAVIALIMASRAAPDNTPLLGNTSTQISNSSPAMRPPYDRSRILPRSASVKSPIAIASSGASHQNLPEPPKALARIPQ